MLALVPFWYSRLAFMQTYHRYLRQAALGTGNFLPPAWKASARNHFVSALLLKDRMYCHLLQRDKKFPYKLGETQPAQNCTR